MFESSTSRIVKSVVDSFNFEKVSDLTKEQFTRILSQSIYKVITDKEYVKEVDKQLGAEAKMSLRGVGLR